jgi:hypothetical protein
MLTQYRDGVDGPWSTFNLEVGEPPQRFRCVPGISLPVILLPTYSQNCESTAKACSERTVFSSNSSTTWKSVGLYDLPLDYVLETFFAGTKGSVGLDNAQFGHNAFQDDVFPSQFIWEVTSLDFFVGVFGLSAGRIALDEADRPGLLSAAAMGLSLPSRSYSYTAGSATSKTLSTISVYPQLTERSLENSTGSLVLGGYDTSRFDAKTTVSIAMPNKQNDSLIISVQAIYISGQTGASWPTASGSKPMDFIIDSSLPQMWLPIEACTVFEKAFGLTWDKELEFYILDESAHSRLLQTNPTVSISIIDGLEAGGEAKNITLPYSAFDLQLSPPLVQNTTYYFPMKRAANPPYVLGRAFLQQTYIIVDYERANFSLSQAYPAGGIGQILPIYNTTSNPSNNNKTMSSPEDTRDKTLSTGAYAGIGIGVGSLVLILAGLLLSWKKGWGFFPKKPTVPDTIIKSELHGEGKPRTEAMEKEWAELEAKQRFEAMDREAVELETVEQSHEVEGATSPTVDGQDGLHELDGDQTRRSESSLRNA